MRYSIEPRDRIYVTSYRFLSFAKNMGKNVLIENFSKTDAIKTASKRIIQKATEATGDLIDNKIADKIMSVSKNLLKNHQMIKQK